MKTPQVPNLPKANSMEKLFTVQIWVRRLIAFLFATFLIGLSTAIMQDLKYTEKPKNASEYFTSDYRALESQIRRMEGDLAKFDIDLHKSREELRNAKTQLNSYTQEFKNWTELRTATENKESNPEVREKLSLLDSKRNVERDLQQTLFRMEQEHSSLLKDIQLKRNQLQEWYADAQIKADEANKWVSLKVFGMRLLFTAPILALGVFAFVRYRNHQYSPLVWGYVWFSMYVFFFGLVPYLPSFGGYIRYIVGIILVVFGGVYAIKSFNKYMEKRKLELERDKLDRARQVDSENAILSFKTHVCPSCGQDYSLSGDTKVEDHKVRNCFNCGLELFKVCSCGKINFAFFKYCSCCGKEIDKSQ